MNFLKTTAVYLALDAIYLGIIQRDTIKRYFSAQNAGSPFQVKLLPGLVAWMLLGWGLQHFVLDHAKSQSQTLWNAALLGLLVYGVYDMTNLATLREWTLSFSITDMLWGMTVLALVAYIRLKWIK